MPPKRASRKSVRTSRSALDSTSGREVHQPSTDDEQEVDMAGELRAMEENLRSNMFVDAGRSKEQSQNRIAADFGSQVAALQAQIEGCFREHREAGQRTRNEYLERLAALVQRKSEVERQIVEHTKELAGRYLTAKREFEVVLQGRSEDVIEAIELLKRLRGDGGAEREATETAS